MQRSGRADAQSSVVLLLALALVAAACAGGGVAAAGVQPGSNPLFPVTLESGRDVRWSDAQVTAMRDKVKDMFYHAYDSYLRYAFPHDELKPLSGTWTDSLGELGNAAPRRDSPYRGVALTLIDSLSTLAVLGNGTEFARAVRWVERHLTFDLDVRVNVFEANIRVLGGLLSAHVLASDPQLALVPGYSGRLLTLAHDLGKRLLRAFRGSASAIPLAWVNLRHGVEAGETRDQCTAGVGTLLLEFGLLSHLTRDNAFIEYADKALNRLWELKSELSLFGNTLDADSLQWKNSNSGIGAGIDSFYEYLFKAYVMFGNSKYLHMFHESYAAVNRHLKLGHWYVEGEMANGRHTHVQFNSLQAFWPGLQVLAGDVDSAIRTHDAFYALWQRYSGLPERYVLNANQLHSTERYYLLRPEFIESTYYLYGATRHPYYLSMGQHVYESLTNVSRVAKGFASVHNVETGQLEDHMHSFFLAETCKYLYLLFDPANALHPLRNDKYVFTTEGHLFPVLSAAHTTRFGDGTAFARYPTDSRSRAANAQLVKLASQSVCPRRRDDVVAAVAESDFMKLTRTRGKPLPPLPSPSAIPGTSPLANHPAN